MSQMGIPIVRYPSLLLLEAGQQPSLWNVRIGLAQATKVQLLSSVGLGCDTIMDPKVQQKTTLFGSDFGGNLLLLRLSELIDNMF